MTSSSDLILRSLKRVKCAAFCITEQISGVSIARDVSNSDEVVLAVIGEDDTSDVDDSAQYSVNGRAHDIDVDLEAVSDNEHDST